MTWEHPLETAPALLECSGLTVKGYSVPPFHVRVGQAVCLHVSLPSPAWYEELLPLLTARRTHPALHFFGTVAYLDRPRPHRRWWGGLHGPSARDWLTTEKELTPAEATTVLNLVDVPANPSVGRIGWNERTIIALEACLLRPPNLLVFDTSGNDSLTARHLFERLSFRPPNLALLYLKTRLGTEDSCLPGSTCLEIIRTPSQATLAE